jgi:DNA-binding NarL/FixJ family response regulator
VYIVEDSAVILERLTLGVQSSGASVVGSCDNAPQAIAEISETRPDLILLDISLRIGTGLDVLDALKATTHNPTVIVLSNFVAPEYRAWSARLGATYFLDKSFETPIALEIVHARVHGRGIDHPSLRLRAPDR